MKTEVEIRTQLQELLSDTRLALPSATVDINALLALVQLSLEAQIKILRWVLD